MRIAPQFQPPFFSRAGTADFVALRVDFELILLWRARRKALPSMAVFGPAPRFIETRID